ncbi:methyltransferase domain-containing protein [Halioglobus maricola]|uniref:Methyltransferase domain-containing protein n=1 Tax=Halioglobus maricola TaxID=2601894 RepID=A0A5P9NLT8_9GAMM|nr:methyltransferase domain-containing protein [Halioglobus maricola]QFU76589.1 methyltransferase domain-containing protein [Halioglobus maricola]
MNWICPHCREPLVKVERSYHCETGHCFDQAKEGYVNLLPANRKRSRDPGDNREMVEARKRVHAADVYRTLAEAVAAYFKELSHASVLDLGCGEGYYGGVVLEHAPKISMWGIDIAKPAVRLAAKAHPRGRFAVASAYEVPLGDSSMDAIFSVFAPVGESEPARLLSHEGFFLNICPAARHLWQLREHLYADPKPHKEVAAALPGLALEKQEKIGFSVALEPPLLADLVAMTPYAYGGQRESKATLEQLGVFEVQMEFLLQCYRREQATA